MTNNNLTITHSNRWVYFFIKINTKCIVYVKLMCIFTSELKTTTLENKNYEKFKNSNGRRF